MAVVEILPVDLVAMVVAAGIAGPASTVDVAILIVVERFFDLSQTWPTKRLDLPYDCQVLYNVNEIKKKNSCIVIESLIPILIQIQMQM